MSRNKSVANTPPYNLFDNEKQRTAFSKRCLSCALRNPDRHEMPQCDVFYYFLQSINDRTVRWEEEWIELGKEGPKCLLYKEISPRK